MRPTWSIISVSMARRPAVSTMQMSRPRRRASSTPALAVATGSPGWLNTGTWMRSPRVRSCSTAAGRCRSAPTSSGLRPCWRNQRASLAALVVLPEPCRPAISTTVGGREAYWRRIASPPSASTSASLTSLTTCWAGLSASWMRLPIARSRMRSSIVLTTTKLTSASRRARRISRSTSSTSDSRSVPLLRSRVKMPSKRSDSDSNMREASLPGRRRPTPRAASRLAGSSPARGRATPPSPLPTTRRLSTSATPGTAAAARSMSALPVAWGAPPVRIALPATTSTSGWGRCQVRGECDSS